MQDRCGVKRRDHRHQRSPASSLPLFPRLSLALFLPLLARGDLDLEALTPHPGDRDLLGEDEAGGEVAEGDDDPGPDEAQLCLEERPAGLDLVWHGVAVARRPALDDVADGALAPVEPDRAEHCIEQLTRSSHEGQALAVLVEPRGLAHEHEGGAGVAVHPYHLGTAPGQPAPGAAERFVTGLCQRLPRHGTASKLLRETCSLLSRPPVAPCEGLRTPLLTPRAPFCPCWG